MTVRDDVRCARRTAVFQSRECSGEKSARSGNSEIDRVVIVGNLHIWHAIRRLDTASPSQSQGLRGRPVEQWFQSKRSSASAVASAGRATATAP